MNKNVLIMLDSSPCIGRCSHKAGDEICGGCGRTRKEVKMWDIMSACERKAVNAVASKRLEQDQTKT